MFDVLTLCYAALLNVKLTIIFYSKSFKKCNCNPQYWVSDNGNNKNTALCKRANFSLIIVSKQRAYALAHDIKPLIDHRE